MACLPKDVLYKSLNQVLRALSQSKDIPEVRSIITLCRNTGLTKQKGSSSIDMVSSPHEFDVLATMGQSEMVHASSNLARTTSNEGENVSPLEYPFIVIEGLDGTGKTTLTRFLSKRLQMKLMSTPPKNFDAFIKARDFFDGQGEPIRRAYYSLGNYLAANEILKSGKPVVMDRFWHSTAAYALAHLKKAGEYFEEPSLKWPLDLLQPDLVIFLQVSEKERLRRHSSRKEFTNTLEEQTLADDKIFRQNLVQYYRNIVGPPFQELFVDGEQQESEAKILKVVLNAFPDLESRFYNNRSI